MKKAEGKRQKGRRQPAVAARVLTKSATGDVSCIVAITLRRDVSLLSVAIGHERGSLTLQHEACCTPAPIPAGQELLLERCILEDVEEPSAAGIWLPGLFDGGTFVAKRVAS